MRVGVGDKWVLVHLPCCPKFIFVRVRECVCECVCGGGGEGGGCYLRSVPPKNPGFHTECVHRIVMPNPTLAESCHNTYHSY